MKSSVLLTVKNLSVRFDVSGQRIDAVKDVSFDINQGETVALVGESGSGKSVTALSLMQLLPYPAASHPNGSIRVIGEELVGASPKILQRIRGNRIGMIFQEPTTSLNPVHTIEKQIREVLTIHKGFSSTDARTRVLELLELVGIQDGEQRLNAYPHELSGGQRQRIMIAMALANEPNLLITDEPTTALDVTIQAQILTLLSDLQSKFGMAILFITHDLAIVNKIAKRVFVMRGGEIVEAGETTTVLSRPSHEYTKRLIEADPRNFKSPIRENQSILLSSENVRVWFPIKSGLLRRTINYIKAVDDVSLTIRKGETLGLVGESGSGKTTLGMALLRLQQSKGKIIFEERNIQNLSTKEMRKLRREMQVVFQDPFGSLSPRMSVGDIIAEGLKVHNPDQSRELREEQVIESLCKVNLDPENRHRYPHEFSGGQRQRIAIARAIVLKPKFVVLDEPTSALDRSVQIQIIDLLKNLQREFDLTYLFISHDLRVIRALSDRIIVMHAGRVVEQGPTEDLFENQYHPYTKALIAAAFDLETLEESVIACVPGK